MDKQQTPCPVAKAEYRGVAPCVFTNYRGDDDRCIYCGAAKGASYCGCGKRIGPSSIMCGECSRKITAKINA